MSGAAARCTAPASARWRQQGLVKGTLLFVAGLLVGANLLYFALTRPGALPAAGHAPTPVAPDVARTVAAPRTGAAVPSDPREPTRTDAAAPLPTPEARAMAIRPPRTVALSSGAPTTPLQALLIPVQGVAARQLQDTFNDARSQGRSHEAIDIMAPAGTPVLAVADGSIEKLFTSDAGGLTVYQFEPSGRHAYYYAHLQAYAPGLAEKQALRRGDVIGYVGSSGNADPAAPHLHFAVFELGPEKRWWQGTAINPYPLLRPQ